MPTESPLKTGIQIKSASKTTLSNKATLKKHKTTQTYTPTMLHLHPYVR